MSFPFYRQHDAMQCGIACLQMVCARYGRKYTSEELSALCHATSEGVSLLGITRAAESLGLHTVCGRLTTGSLREAVLPCILHWNQSHFVVLYRIGRHRRGEVYYIADPGKGLITYGAEDFKACWVSTRSGDEDKGIAMLLTPTPAFGTRSGGEVGETAHIDEYVRSLPLGYNTMIGRDGVGLSAGQRQRILIARAVYKNPEFIFLDEATNSLGQMPPALLRWGTVMVVLITGALLAAACLVRYPEKVDMAASCYPTRPSCMKGKILSK
jgi:ABC-type bacteriocin/lantibiotic exporter with double-glycine peptidase domain